jgi:hypothetical protein
MTAAAGLGPAGRMGKGGENGRPRLATITA